MEEEKVRAVAWRLLGKVEAAVEAVAPDDRGGMKQLTGVLKDLQDILSPADPMAQRERELKLRRLELELQCAANTGITVTLQGEAEDFAK